MSDIYIWLKKQAQSGWCPPPIMQAGLSKSVRRPKYRTYCNVPLLALICCKMALFGIFCCNPDPDPFFFNPDADFLSQWTQIYLTYCNVPLSLICPKMSLFGLFWCNPDPDPDLWTRCRFWSGWTHIYWTYCNVPLLGLICPKMPLLGLFGCNPDPETDFCSRCRFYQDGPRYP